MTMQEDHHFVMYSGEEVKWKTDCYSADWAGPARVTMQDDGNFVQYDGDERAIWCTRTDGGVAKSTEGEIEKMVGGEEIASRDTLNAGETLNADEELKSLNGEYRMVMQGDGNLVLLEDPQEVLQTS